MAPKLYMVDLSPAVRAVLLTEKALGIQLEHIPVDLSKKEHLQPGYLKLNPQHTVPTLDDDGKIIWDSHAINVYLVTKYGKDDSLYPKDAYKRAIVDQRMYFDCGVIFATGKRMMRGIIHEGLTRIPDELLNETVQGLEILEQFLEGSKWVAGDCVTLADFSLISTVTTLSIISPIDPKKFPNVTGWLERAKSLPYYGVNVEGLEKMRAFLKTKLQ